MKNFFDLRTLIIDVEHIIWTISYGTYHMEHRVGSEIKLPVFITAQLYSRRKAAQPLVN